MSNHLIEAAIAAGFTATAAIMGYIAGVIAVPSKLALLVAALTGLGGGLNQLRVLLRRD